MVSNIPFYSGKEINLRRRVPFVTILLLVLFFFVLIPSHPPVVLFCLFAGYASSGYLIKFWRFFKNKKKSETIGSE
jgi:CDP-diacylglycerol--serine O-phosphatidyltransferase